MRTGSAIKRAFLPRSARNKRYRRPPVSKTKSLDGTEGNVPRIMTLHAKSFDAISGGHAQLVEIKLPKERLPVDVISRKKGFNKHRTQKEALGRRILCEECGSLYSKDKKKEVTN